MTHHHKQLPNHTGISLKAQHYQTILDNKPDIAWFECHPENYMGEGGLPHYFLRNIAEHYPLSMHGVGLSLGSSDGIDHDHLQALSALVKHYQPAQVSEHLAWSHWNAHYLNDLLPLPYTDVFLNLVCANIQRVQEALQQTILVENPSAYLGFADTTMSETAFLRAITKQTDCGLLLDINNVHVSAHNLGYDAYEYIDHYPLDAVGEIHLAGHAENSLKNGSVLLIDDHGSSVKDEVWKLFEYTLKKLKRPVPVLLEWDTNVPELNSLLDEAKRAEQYLEQCLAHYPKHTKAIS